MKSKKDLWFSQLARIFSVNYVVMDTSNIYCIVGFSLCKKYARLFFGSILKLYGKLIKVSSTMQINWICILV